MYCIALYTILEQFIVNIQQTCHSPKTGNACASRKISRVFDSVHDTSETLTNVE
jgi:hypothetical protein